MQTTPSIEAQRDERLARRASSSSKRTAKPTAQHFVHQPVAPYVPEQAEYAPQRSFTRGNANRSLEISSAKATFDFDTPRTFAEVSVFRWADQDVAEVTLSVGAGRSESSTTVAGTAKELREIAARILDAAHDLDVNPSAVLTRMAA